LYEKNNGYVSGAINKCWNEVIITSSFLVYAWTLQNTTDHPRTARKTAGHTAELGETGSKTSE